MISSARHDHLPFLFCSHVVLAALQINTFGEVACKQTEIRQSFGKFQPVPGNAEANQTKVTDVCWAQVKRWPQSWPPGFGIVGALDATIQDWFSPRAPG